MCRACVAVGLAVALLAMAGCVAVAPGHDPALVRAEQALEVSFATIDAFLLAEHTHREAIAAVEPRAHEVAEDMRERAPDVLKAARDAVDAYRSHRTPERRATMETYLAVLEELARQARVIVAKWKGGAV